MADKELGLGVLFTAAVGNFAADLEKVKTQLQQVAKDIESLNTKAAASADKVTKAQEKAAESAKKTAESVKASSKGVAEGAEAATKATEGLAAATTKATTASQVHGKSLAEVRAEMGKLAANTTSQIAASKMSGDVYDSLAKKLAGAKNETIQYRTALANAAVESGSSTLRFNQLAGALQAGEKSILQTSSNLQKLGVETTSWAAGVDRGKFALATLNGELFKSEGVVLSANSKYATLQNGINALKTEYGAAAWSATDMDNKLGNQIKTLAGAKSALTSFTDGVQLHNTRAEAARGGIENLNKAHTELSKIAGLSANAHNQLAEAVRKGGLSTDQAVTAGKSLVTNQQGLESQTVRLTARYRELVESTGKYGDQARAVMSSMKISNDGMVVATEKLKEINKEFVTAEKGTAAFNKAVTNLGSQNTQTSAFISGLNDKIKSGTLTHADAAKQVDIHGKELVKLSNHAQSTTGFWNNLTGKLIGGGAAAQAASDYFSRLGQAVGSLAAWIPAALIIGGLTEAISGAINAVKDYDQALKSLQAISGGTAAEVSLLGKTMLQISDTTKYSAAEIAKGAIYVAQAGFSAGEALQVIGAAAKGAQGTLEPLTTAANLLTTVLRAYHIEASQSSRVMDMLAMAANKSKTDLEGMKVVFNYLGPAAYSAGVSLNETLGTLMALSNVGMRMSTVGTSLRQVFIGLENPSAKLKAALKDAGMTVEDLSVKKLGADGNPQGLVPVLQNLDKVIGGSLTNAVQFFNVRAGNAALVISQMNSHVAMMIKFTEEYGAAAAMAGTQSEGMAVKISMLSNQFQNFIIRMAQGGPTDAFNSLITAASKLISVIEYLVNNPIANFILTSGVMYGSLLLLSGIISKTAIALASLFVSEAATVAMKTVGVIQGLSGAYAALALTAGTSATVVGSLSAGTFVYTAAATTATGVTGFFATAINTLTAAMLRNPWTIALVGLAALAAAIYLATTGAEKHSKILQENTISLSNNAVAAQNFAVSLRTLKEDQDKGKNIASSYNSVLGEMVKTFPNLRAQIALTNKDLEAQAVILDKEALKFQKLTDEMAKASVEDLNKQYTKFNKEIDLNSKALALNKESILVWGKEIKGADDVAKKLNQSTLDQMNLAPQYASVIMSASAASREALLKAIPEGEMRKQVVSTVAMYDAMVASLKVGATELEKKNIDAVANMGGAWYDYYMKQSDMGKTEVAEAAARADKKIEIVMKSFEKEVSGNKDAGTLIKNERIRLTQEAYEKMITHQSKFTEDLLKLEDKLYEEQHKRRKTALDVTLTQLDLAQKQEIVQLGNKQLKEAEYIAAKEKIESAYFEKNRIVIEDSSKAELASIDTVFKAKMATLEAGKTLLGPESYEMKKVALETENTVKLIAAYRDQMAALKIHITEKITEHGRYKAEYDKALAEIQRLELTHLALVERENKQHLEKKLSAEKQYRQDVANADLQLSKSVEGVEQIIRDARQSTMEAREKMNDREAEIRETMAKGYAALAEAERASDSQAKIAKVKAAEDYFKQAQGMISGIATETKGTDGKIIISAEEVRDKKISAAGAVKSAYEAANTAMKLADASKRDEAIAASDAETKKSIDDSAKRKDALQADLKLIAEAADKNMKAVTEEIGKLQEKFNEFAKLTAEKIVIKADTTQAFADMQKIVDTIKDDQEKGRYKIVLEFMAKASPEGPLSEVIVNIREKLSGLVDFLKQNLNFGFLVTFLGDYGSGKFSLASVIGAVWRDISELSNKINGLITVHTIVTKYVTEGTSPSEQQGLARGGEVSGIGDSDSVPAMLTPGEFVIKKSSTRSLGEGFLNYINTYGKRFASGGSVNEVYNPYKGYGRSEETQKLVEILTTYLQQLNKGVGYGWGEVAHYVSEELIKRLTDIYESERAKLKADQDQLQKEAQVVDRENAVTMSITNKLDTLMGKLDALISRLVGTKFASGGSVSGSEGGDTVPAMLTPGEFVIRKSVVSGLGAGFFSMINRMKSFSVPKFNMGGMVPAFAQGGMVGKEEVFTINLQANQATLPLRVVGNPDTMRNSIRNFEKELSRMRLSHG